MDWRFNMIYPADVQKMSPNELVSWFLISSYAYYELGRPVMADMTFDNLTQKLKERYEEADHPHKHLITQSHLDATTGYDIEYPGIVKYSAMNYLRSYRESR